MQPGQPSRTALGAAGHRAAHQVLEQGFIFSDPLAVRILGADAEAAILRARENPERRLLRLFIAVRTRFAEDTLTTAIAGGVGQLVILGAGLDTYAYRANNGGQLRIFEVDHPATQAWKRRRLEESAIPIPEALTFAPVDFERETLADGLAAAGFDSSKRTFFTWLGVVPYLTEQAIFSTLTFITGLPGGAGVVFDYGNPPGKDANDAGYAAAGKTLAERVAAIGEEIKTQFETPALHERLMSLGFHEIEDLGPAQILDRFFPNWRGPAPDRGGHVIRAATVSKPRDSDHASSHHAMPVR